MAKPPVVYIVKEQMQRRGDDMVPFNYSPAAEYGDLEFITRHDMPLYAKSSVQDVWNRDVARFVKVYDEVVDYVVPTGQPMAIMAVGVALGQAGKTPRFLIWRNDENRYRVVEWNSTALLDAA